MNLSGSIPNSVALITHASVQLKVKFKKISLPSKFDSNLNLHERVHCLTDIKLHFRLQSKCFLLANV